MVQRYRPKCGTLPSSQRPTTSPEPFAQAAPELLRAGAVPIACEGKRAPLMGWPQVTHSEAVSQFPDMIARFGAANVGISCGASRLVVVDIDWAELLDEMVRRFGPTPLIIRSPSDGFHMYFRAGTTDVGCRNLRKSEGLSVDIKGRGGLVIAPPSRDPLTAKPYSFHSGSWGCLPDLPLFPADRLPEWKDGVNAGKRPASRVRQGERNNWLFRELLKVAPHCDDFDALLDVAQTKNDHVFEVPLPASEIVATA
jgi:hypothetical protein